MFEVKKVRTGEKRKREGKGDPGDVDGYMGPWRWASAVILCSMLWSFKWFHFFCRGYVDQEMVSRPTDEQKAIIEKQFGDKQKKKKKDEEEETIEESTMLHSEYLL